MTVRAFTCGSCGASVTMQAAGWSVTVACSTCGAVLDALDPNLRVLQQHRDRLTFTPKIPLGTRGRLRGRAVDVIGCQRVTITVEGVDYSWTEYVCFNPYHGFQYLSEYNGHWNVIEKLRTRPEEPIGGSTAVHEGRTYQHFQSATARTSAALGEFPWELRVGDEVRSRDFTSAPYLLSAEGTALETTWSRGTYTPPAEIARAFGLKALDTRPEGVFANQPNPHLRGARAVRRAWWRLTLALVALFVATRLLSANATVLSDSAEFVRGKGEENAVVFGPFDMGGRTSNARIRVQSDVSNDWLWFGLSLINEDNGEVRDVSAQTSYYFGRDSDGSWSEGSQKDDVTIAEVPAGRYLLRVAPEGEPRGTPRLLYSVAVDRDVPSVVLFVLAAFALSLPMVVLWLPALGFEQRRWNESDHEGAKVPFHPDVT